MDAEPLGRVTQFLHLLRGALPSSGFRATACPLASRVHRSYVAACSDTNEAGRPTLYIGVRRRFPACVPVAAQAQMEHKLQLIAELRYETYFLTVYDIVQFARQNGNLCQGRGSAANSCMRHARGVTEVDPSGQSMVDGNR